MKTKRSRLWAGSGAVGVAVLMTLVAFAGMAAAPPPADNPGQPFEQIMDAIEELGTDIEGIQSDIDGLQDGIDDLDSAIQDLQDDVDDLASEISDLSDTIDDLATEVEEIEDKLDFLSVEAYGVEGFADPGEGPEWDGSNNALILVRVTWKGEGVGGLTVDNFDIATRLVPPGNAELEIDEFNFFGTHFLGDYGLKVTPIDSAGIAWAAGEYVSSIEVTWNGMSGSTIVAIEVT